MSDWRSMSAGPELDRLIAERLGWNMTPDCGDRDLPRYSTDLNVAITLTIPRNGMSSLTPSLWSRQDDGWYASFESYMIVNSTDGERADTPELAICRAWLAYNEAQEKMR